jgi:hypothetical protein
MLQLSCSVVDGTTKQLKNRGLTMNECNGSGGSVWGDDLGDRIECILTYGGNAVDCRINYTLATVSLIACGSLQCLLQKQRRKRQLQEQHERLQQEPSLSYALPAEPSEEAAAAAAATDERTRSTLTVKSQEDDSGSLLLPREHDNNDNTHDPQKQEESLSSYSIRTIPIPTVRSALISLGFAVAFQIGLCLGLQCSGISIVWCAMAGWMVRAIVRRQNGPSTNNNSTTAHGNAFLRLFGGCCSCELWNNNIDSLNNGNDYCGKLVVQLALFSDAAGIVYYAVTAEAITTVAHVCALVMGATLYSLSVWANTTPPPPPPPPPRTIRE